MIIARYRWHVANHVTFGPIPAFLALKCATLNFRLEAAKYLAKRRLGSGPSNSHPALAQIPISNQSWVPHARRGITGIRRAVLLIQAELPSRLAIFVAG